MQGATTKWQEATQEHGRKPLHGGKHVDDTHPAACHCTESACGQPAAAPGCLPPGTKRLRAPPAAAACSGAASGSFVQADQIRVSWVWCVGTVGTERCPPLPRHYMRATKAAAHAAPCLVACQAANSSRPSVAMTLRRWKSTVAGLAYSRFVTSCSRMAGSRQQWRERDGNATGSQ